MKSFCLIILLCPLAIVAQQDMDEISFTVDGEQLEMPYAGGLNSVIICKEDLNNNGKKDLLLFEQSDNTFIAFRNDGAAGEVNYVYDESLLTHFPDSTSGWAYLADYNNDGVADLFTPSPQGGAGIGLYRGRWENDRLAFDVEINWIETVSGYQLFGSTTKLPAITDINGDGDTDILMFESGGSVIEYFENQAMELGTPLDTFIVKRKTNCWGHVCECGANNAITLGYNDNYCFHNLRNPFPQNENKARHLGSTIMLFDPDNDGDMDGLMGDAGFPNLAYLENRPAEHDSIAQLDTLFPSYSTPVTYKNFATPYYVDANNDGSKDLLISSFSDHLCYFNQVTDTPYNASLMFYKNVGTGGKDTFEHASSDFLVGEMLDFGLKSHPTFFDYNNDGLLDIVVGRCYEYSATGPDSIQLGLALLENTGTATDPAFELVDQDFAGLGQYGYLSVAPHFADMDQDGDKDLIIGESNGELVFFENTAPAGEPASFSRRTQYFDSLPSFSKPAPFAADVDQDGVMDLLIGDRQGRIHYYHNDGSATDPDLNLETSNWGGVDVRGDNFEGQAVPWLGDLDKDGARELLVGNFDGQVMQYTNIDGNIDGNFTRPNNNFLNMRWGKQLTIAAADINDDGKLDYLTGNYRGGIRLKSVEHVGVEAAQQRALLDFQVFPNPASDQLKVKTSQPVSGTIVVYNATGSVLFSQPHPHGITSTLDVGELPAGIYLIAIKTAQATQVKKVVVEE